MIQLPARGDLEHRVHHGREPATRSRPRPAEDVICVATCHTRRIPTGRVHRAGAEARGDRARHVGRRGDEDDDDAAASSCRPGGTSRPIRVLHRRRPARNIPPLLRAPASGRRLSCPCHHADAHSLLRPGRRVPRRPGGRPSPAGCIAAAITAASSSSTCAIARACCRSCSIRTRPRCSRKPSACAASS